MKFEEALRYLLGLGHETLAIKLGLKNTQLLLAALGDPHKSYESVQIAGTNGKGSAAVVLDSICRAAGIRTGLYTSPHLVSITERIVVGGHEISKEDFARYASVVRIAAEHLVSAGKLEALPTFFEHVTVIALLAFKEAGVSLAILETGLGGRLDATTVAAAQTVGITTLALDHQALLGETLEEIAYEKAAIIRPGVAAIIAAQPPQALEVILRRCAECNVSPDVDYSRADVESVTDDGRLTVTFETEGERYENVMLGLRGRHQITNIELAIRLAETLRRRGFEMPKAAIIKGIKTASHAGRLDAYPSHPSVLLDGAHNPSGAQALREYLDEFVRVPLTLVFGAMRDKNLEAMARILFPAPGGLVLTKPDNQRAASVEELRELAISFVDHGDIFAAQSVSEALERAKNITPPNGLICITGSLYLVGQAKEILEQAALPGVANQEP